MPAACLYWGSMGGKYHRPGRNAWHLGFVDLVSARAPADAILSSEVELSRRPSRVDLVVIRRRAQPWHAVRDPDAIDWLQQWVYTTEQTMSTVKKSRSFQEIRQKILGSMTPEERLAGLAPEERLAGLSAAERERMLVLLSELKRT